MKVLEQNEWSTAPRVSQKRESQSRGTVTAPGESSRSQGTLMCWVGFSLVTATTLVTFELLTLFLIEQNAGVSLIQASSWAAGFLLLALAVDGEGRAAMTFLLAGLSVLIFTLLSVSLGPELLLIPVALLAVWLGSELSRRLFP